MSHKKDKPQENEDLIENEDQVLGESEIAENVSDENVSEQSDEIEKLNQEIAALKDHFIREKAENDNLRKRQERELANAHKFATERLLKDLLPVLDSLTLGLQAEKEAKEKGNVESNVIDQFIQGSEMTLNLLRDILSKHGIEEVDPSGEKFDPEKHEAVTTVPTTEYEPNTVMHVAQKGYVLNGRTIRAAQVVVAKSAD